MVPNKVSAALEQTVADEMIADVINQEAKLPFLITLTQKQKSALPRFDDQHAEYFTQALQTALQNPGMMPREFDVTEMRKDVELYNVFYPVVKRYITFTEKLTDTLKEIGAEAYSASLLVYTMAKVKGQNVGGMEAAVDELGKRFARKTGGSTPTPPPTPAQ